jgi:hypothetical protein
MSKLPQVWFGEAGKLPTTFDNDPDPNCNDENGVMSPEDIKLLGFDPNSDVKAGGPGSGRHPGPDHYMKGYKLGPTKLGQLQTVGAEQKADKLARSYASKYPGDTKAFGEHYRGLLDGKNNSSTTHGVYEHRGDGQYQKSNPLHTEIGETKAREWLENNESTLPASDRGYVVRKPVSVTAGGPGSGRKPSTEDKAVSALQKHGYTAVKVTPDRLMSVYRKDEHSVVLNHLKETFSHWTPASSNRQAEGRWGKLPSYLKQLHGPV